MSQQQELTKVQDKIQDAQEALTEAQTRLTLLLQAPPPQPTQPQPTPTPLPPTDPSVKGSELALVDPGEFYDYLRGAAIIGPKISEDEFDGCEVLLEACFKEGLSWADTAYVLATAFHETAGTMQPVKEYGGNSYYFKMYDIQGQRPDKARELGNTSPGDGVKYPGRGYPQVTGKSNYQKLTDHYGTDYVNNPDLLLQSHHAALATAYPLKVGMFTGKKLSDYLPRKGRASRDQFVQSRRTVNGTDKADQIAGHAMIFQDAIMAGQYKLEAA